MTEPKYLLFLGCLIPYRISSYETSARKVLGRLGVELVEMPEFNCCGFPLDPVSHDTMVALAARNLCLAEQKEINIMTLCNGCFSILNHVNKNLKENEDLREKINGYLREIGMEFKGTIEVKHIIHVLIKDIGLEKLKNAVQKPLNTLRVAQHSGCHVLRPAKDVSFDDPENPTALKNLIRATGAECLNYIDEPECCGAPIIGVNDKIPLQVARGKLERIRAVGAQAMITICPSCHMMYDLNQPRIEKTFNEKIGIPVLHYTQLLGLAMGFSPDELAMKELRVDTSQIMSRL
jgi:heterodisulfide reductase subunit B